MTAKRLMLLSLFCSVLGISVLLLSQTNSESATTSSKQAAKQTVKVLVPTRTIEIGQTYTPNSFRWKEVPQQELENYIDHVTPDDISAAHTMSGLARTKLVKDSILSKADITEPAPYGRFKGLNMTTMAETDVSTASYSSAYLYRLVAD